MVGTAHISNGSSCWLNKVLWSMTFCQYAQLPLILAWSRDAVFLPLIRSLLMVPNTDDQQCIFYYGVVIYTLVLIMYGNYQYIQP
jgi:hypothetical protein